MITTSPVSFSKAFAKRGCVTGDTLLLALGRDTASFTRSVELEEAAGGARLGSGGAMPSAADCVEKEKELGKEKLVRSRIAGNLMLASTKESLIARDLEFIIS